MSYDVWLEINTGGPERAVVCECGNYTSNVRPMWDLANAWPGDFHNRQAKDCIEQLRSGIARMEDFPSEFRALNPENGWGNSDGALDFLRSILQGCLAHPLATVVVSR